MKGPISTMTSSTTTIFGTKVSVISWTWVRAWSSAITMPTSMAAPTAGPEPTMIVQIAAWIRSSASASFISADRDAVGDGERLTAVEQRRRAGRADVDGQHLAGDRAVGRGQGPADHGVCLRQGRG